MLSKIKKDSLKARKEKSPETKTYSYLLGEIQKLEKAKNSNFNKNPEEDILKLLQKLKNDTLDTISKLTDEKAKESYIVDLKVFERYLPKQLTEDELTKIVEKIINEFNDKKSINIGIVMGQLKKNFNGKYNGKTASQIINKLLKK